MTFQAHQANYQERGALRITEVGFLHSMTTVVLILTVHGVISTEWSNDVLLAESDGIMVYYRVRAHEAENSGSIE